MAGALIAIPLWFQSSRSSLIVAGVIYAVVLAIGWSRLRGLDSQDCEVVARETARANLIGGFGWGQFVLLGMPREVEAQLLFALLVLAVVGVNMIESHSVPHSFMSFHVPFVVFSVVAYVSQASGTARWAAWLIVLCGLYFPWLARTGFRVVADAAELSVKNAGLVEQLQGLNEQLAYQSTHDQLTGLPNRAAIDEHLAELFAEPDDAAHEPETIGALFIDLDRFKDINDTLGHHAGDELLTIVGRRLSELVDDSMFLARLGGDEMVIVIKDADRPRASALADEVVRTLSATVVLLGRPCAIGASVGVAIVKSDEASSSDLMRFADAALYTAKALGRGQHAVFTPAMLATIEDQPAQLSSSPLGGDPRVGELDRPVC